MAGAFLRRFIVCAFGFGAAKARTVGVGLFRRLFPLVALLESFQVDDVPHARLHHSAARRQKRSRCAQAKPMVIQNPRVELFDSINKWISLCENNMIGARTMR